MTYKNIVRSKTGSRQKRFGNYCTTQSISSIVSNPMYVGGQTTQLLHHHNCNYGSYFQYCVSSINAIWYTVVSFVLFVLSYLRSKQPTLDTLYFWKYLLCCCKWKSIDLFPILKNAELAKRTVLMRYKIQLKTRRQCFHLPEFALRLLYNFSVYRAWTWFWWCGFLCSSQGWGLGVVFITSQIKAA